VVFTLAAPEPRPGLPALRQAATASISSCYALISREPTGEPNTQANSLFPLLDLAFLPVPPAFEPCLLLCVPGYLRPLLACPNPRAGHAHNLFDEMPVPRVDLVAALLLFQKPAFVP
jgi:hypothetical protein